MENRDPGVETQMMTRKDTSLVFPWKRIIGLVLGIFIAGALIFLFLQNNSLKSQMQNQRLHIVQQAEIIDSLRRSDLVNMMSNVLDNVEDELKDNPRRILSEERIAGIIALCYLLKPYANLEGDSLSEKKLSPERGQILLMLHAMHIDSVSFQKIMLRASFSGAVLREADLNGADLRWADLSGADLQEANLKGANLNETNLRKANLWGANLSGAKLKGAVLERADLRWADLDNADLRNANLNGSFLNSAQLRNTDFHGATIIWADATGALLNNSNMTGVNLTGTKLIRANLNGSNLSNANLILANMTETNLINSDLSETEMLRITVSDWNWLNLLNEWHVTGAGEIQKKYKITNDRINGRSRLRLNKIED